MEKIKHCPVCGSEAYISEFYTKGIASEKHYRIKCKNCTYQQVNEYNSIDKAIKNWNDNDNDNHRMKDGDNHRMKDVCKCCYCHEDSMTIKQIHKLNKDNFYYIRCDKCGYTEYIGVCQNDEDAWKKYNLINRSIMNPYTSVMITEDSCDNCGAVNSFVLNVETREQFCVKCGYKKGDVCMKDEINETETIYNIYSDCDSITVSKDEFPIGTMFLNDGNQLCLVCDWVNGISGLSMKVFNFEHKETYQVYSNTEIGVSKFLKNVDISY